MIEETEGHPPPNDQTPAGSGSGSRRVEDLGSSENPIVIGVSPLGNQPRTNTEQSRARASTHPRLSSRRKCPLGAYVEIIDESIPSRPVPSCNSNRGLQTTNAATIPPINLRGEPVGTTSIDAPPQPAISENGNITSYTSTPSPNPETTSGILNVSSNFEILMRCSICMEIFHNPVNVCPCNHKFCSSCILSWKRTNQMAVCPQCRGPILSMQKDALFSEVVESFLVANPSKRRSPSELEAVDAVEAECSAWQSGVRIRRRGLTPQPRTRAARDRTVRTPFVVRVSQIRAHRSPLAARQRGHRGIMEWFDL